MGDELSMQTNSDRSPYVIVDGQRLLMLPAVMESSGLKEGQRINDEVFAAILRANISYLGAEVALTKLRRLVGELEGADALDERREE